ncbi:hypothetical protein OKJ48_20655 [Streptomyces kunmingensis]|uniref:Lipoprotein n=1 Tax=Streptomyces kunmingensis TaxID=68225 RepID=A0ABU6CDV8_9ACTN|nr:hypothetical protein [Streptomyces kunmingensis]MEB3962644.1 hypothetical protein [Streptomyces kunmingensis]
MHAIRAASAAVLSLTALSLAAPFAAAGDEHAFEADVSPTTVAAGGRVMLSQSGCKGRTEVSAGIFDAVSLGKDNSSKSVTVDWDAKQGAMYSVQFACEGHRTRSVDLTIAGGRPDDSASPPADHGVDAGVGGSIGGFDLHEIGLGAALITGAVGTAYYFSRRRTGDGKG